MESHWLANGSVLVSTGAVWKYLDTGTNVNPAWRNLEFDDTAWPSGPAPLGYDDEGSTATTISYGPDEANKHITTWFRHAFVVRNAADCRRSLLRLLRDDGAAVYLNGTEIVRDNLPSGTITSTNLALEAVEEGLLYHVFEVNTPLREGTNVLAVEVHQWDTASSDLLFDLELSCPLSRGPYLQMGTPTSIVVRWRTADPTASWVHYGTNSGNLNLSTGAAVLTNEHQVLLTGLRPDKRYFYAVGMADKTLASGPEYSFLTAPTHGKPTRILVTSDMQDENPRLLPALAQFANGRVPDLWLTTGDTGGDSDADFQRNLFNSYADLLQQTVIWPCMGNHDSGLLPEFLDTFTLPTQGEASGVASGTEHYYSFNYGSIHCVVLNSISEIEDTSTNGPMYAWLARDLAANDRDWLIAYWHYPPYTKGGYDSDQDPDLRSMRENFLPLLEAQGVDLVLSGHNHIYERSYLLDSHYGLSTTLEPRTMIRNGGDGRWDGSGPYCKPATGPNPHQGTVYAKVTSAYNYGVDDIYPAMYITQEAVGCLVIDIDGAVLEATFLRDNGQIGDYFTIIKGVKVVPPRIGGVRVEAGRCHLAWPSVPGAYYRIHRNTALTSDWVPVSLWLRADSRTMSWSEPLQKDDHSVFYRIQVATE
jgi:hypothetical protein